MNPGLSTIWVYAIWYAACYAAGRALFSTLRLTMFKAGHTRLNFQGRAIPTSLGAGFALLAIMMGLVVALGARNAIPNLLPATLIIVMSFGLLGLLDDMVAQREPGGLKGHIARLGTSHEFSTALIKAIFGLLVCFLVSGMYWKNQGLVMVFINGVIVALSANTVNLLDVRPGRAIKGFMLVFSLLLVISLAGRAAGWAQLSHSTLVILVPFLIWTFAYASIDFRCDGMLGDAGSNILGSILGVFIAAELSVSNRWLALGLLVGFLLLCEVTSLSSIIENVKFLKKLDLMFIKPGKEPPKAE